jgi:predicted dienelactone hydrolase
MKSIARKCFVGLMMLAAVMAPIRLTAQEQPESSTSAGAVTPNPVPLINQPLVPDAAKPGGAAFTLTVNGTGFVSGSVVEWNGSARATTFVGKSQLKANIFASDIAKAETASVTVVNPGPGGGRSNVAFFEITPPSFSVAFARADSGPLAVYQSVAVGDFNGDGRLDLALADWDGGALSVMLGNGNGTFQAAVSYNAGADAGSVAVGDFNGDGKLDVVVANGFSKNVSVLLGNGDGTFHPAVNYGAGSGPSGVAVGDFNGDGKLDLAVANNGDNTVGVLLGNGDGTFRVMATHAVGIGPISIAVGDFNSDGKLDLVVANSGEGTVSVLLGNGDGTFQVPVNYGAGSQPAAVVAADFNGDGKLDLVVANSGEGTVSVLLGNGDGTFQVPVNYGAGSQPAAVVAADFNGDGKLDLVVANSGSNSISVLLGNGDGTFKAAVDYAVGVVPLSVAAGDFNGDGRIDLGVSGRFGVSLLLQIPTASLSKTRLTFADHLVGTSSAAQAVTFSNTSWLTLNISSIVLTGTNAADFSQTHTCGSSLAPGANCTIDVTFKPTHIGPRTASVTITDNAAGSPQMIALSGAGVVSGPNATFSPTASLTFATQVVGTTSTTQSVTLSDYGTAALSISSIVASGDFNQTHTCGSRLAAGASCTINLTFSPTQIGTRTGTLTITDDAPGSPQQVSLTGTGTVVKFSPTSLAFHCHIKPYTCPPPPQTTTLTNTGSTTLSISSITITGSADFSQTNTCRSTVVAKGSCTITVAFTSPFLTQGTFSGAVSVSDNGGGSPQQVTLSATKTKTGAGALAVRSAIAAQNTAAVPSPTGPSQVGTRVVHLVDSTRDDPFLAEGAKRELLVRFWYPTTASQSCELAAYTSPAVWSYFSELAEFPLPEVRTNSCLDAPITEGSHPVVVFTHGYTGTFTDYTFILEDLASRGYVIAAVDHTYEATAVEFPHGRLVKSVFGSHLADSTCRRDEQSLSFAVSVRLKDLKFVVDELARLNGEASGPFAAKLDLSRVGVAGHSLGGLAALLDLKQDARIKAAVLLDASVPDGSASLTDTPVLVMAMGREQWSDEECRLWSDLRGPRFAVNLKGAEHLTPSDAIWLAKGAIRTGSMGPDKAIEALRNYIAAFLDTNLRSKPFDPLLTGPSSDYPDAEVTTQKQLLCGEAIDH